MPFFVDCESKGDEAFVSRLDERLVGVVDGVFLLCTVAAVAISVMKSRRRMPDIPDPRRKLGNIYWPLSRLITKRPPTMKR